MAMVQVLVLHSPASACILLAQLSLLNRLGTVLERLHCERIVALTCANFREGCSWW